MNTIEYSTLYYLKKKNNNLTVPKLGKRAATKEKSSGNSTG